MIFPSRTTTAPTGTSPAVYAFCACRNASRMKSSSFTGSIIDNVATVKSYIVTRECPLLHCNLCNCCNFLSCGGSRACRKFFFGILGTAHAKQHRIASGREACVQTVNGLREEGAH